jgi:hypothetical protein
VNSSINPKVSAGAFAGALVVLIVALLVQYTSFDPEPAVVAAMTTIATFVVAWLVPETLWKRASIEDAENLPDVLPAQPTDVSKSDVPES